MSDDERDDNPDNVIPIRGRRMSERAGARPYLEPGEQHRSIAAVSKLTDHDGLPVNRIGLWFYIQGYPGIALTPTQARALGQLLTMAADDVDPPNTEPNAS